MNLMGYDAAVLGEGDLAQLGVEVIQQRIAQAEFPFLSANVYLSASGERLAEPYHIVDVGPLRVALIGVTGQADVSGLEIRDPVEAVREAVDAIGPHAHVLILLSHAGLERNRQIAAQVPALDLIVSGGGPQMTYVAEGDNGAPLVVHADVSVTGHAGRRIGVGTLTFDQDGVLQGQTWQALPLDSQIPDDPAMSAWEASNR
jgi:2',3'-cyclic-nucleotide 2'-phosphodiesterase (5'-nucleotidase family)